MLPTPAKTGPGGALAVNIDNDSMGDLTKAFSIALQPLVKGIKNLNNNLVKSMAPDPASRTDRGKDLIKDPEQKSTDPGLKDMSIGLFGKAALAILAASLLGVRDELQGIVNAIAFPRILKAVRLPFVALGKGLDAVKKTVSGIVNLLNRQNKSGDLRKVFGKAGLFDRFFLAIGRLGTSISNTMKRVTNSVKTFLKNGPVGKFFGSVDNISNSIKSFDPSVMKTKAAFGKGGNLGKFFLTVGNLTDRVASFFRPLTRVVTGLGKLLAPIGNLAKSLGGLLAPLLPLLKIVALPITIILGVIDGIKGFIEGYKDQGFLDGILTAIGSVLGGLIGAPLDLLKNIAAFILEKLGFESVAETLKDFSFKELIKNAFGGIANFFANIPSFIEGALRALPGGDFLADKIFGKGSDKAIAGQISGTDKAQEEAQIKIDQQRKTLDVGLANRQSQIDKMEPGARRDREQRKLDRQKAIQEKKLREAEDKQKIAGIKGLALKTKDIDIAQMAAGGASAQDILANPQVQAAMQQMTPTEMKLFQDKIQNQQGLSPEQLFEESQRKRGIVAELTGAKPDSQLSEEIQKKMFVEGAQADLARKQQGLAPGDDVSFQVKEGQVVPKKPVGPVLDDQSRNINQIQTSGGSTDNSQTDNSTNTNNSQNINNYFGGSGGGGMNTTNRDGSLFPMQGTYGA